MHSARFRKPGVALFARAWIEMLPQAGKFHFPKVALFARAWIEIDSFSSATEIADMVALFARAWIEIVLGNLHNSLLQSRPLCEGVD